MSSHWHLQNISFMNCVFLRKQWEVIPSYWQASPVMISNALVDCSDVLIVFKTALPNINSESLWGFAFRHWPKPMHTVSNRHNTQDKCTEWIHTASAQDQCAEKVHIKHTEASAQSKCSETVHRGSVQSQCSEHLHRASTQSQYTKQVHRATALDSGQSQHTEQAHRPRAQGKYFDLVHRGSAESTGTEQKQRASAQSQCPEPEHSASTQCQGRAGQGRTKQGRAGQFCLCDRAIQFYGSLEGFESPRFQV